MGNSWTDPLREDTQGQGERGTLGQGGQGPVGEGVGGGKTTAVLAMFFLVARHSCDPPAQKRAGLMDGQLRAQGELID